MSIYTCIDVLIALGQDHPCWQPTTTSYVQELKRISKDNDVEALLTVLRRFKEDFSPLLNTHILSPKRYLPIDAFRPYQQCQSFVKELSACIEISLQQAPPNLAMIYWPSNVRLTTSVKSLQPYYQALLTELQTIKRATTPAIAKAQWETFETQTNNLRHELFSSPLSEAYQSEVQRFLHYRKLIQNQLAFNYLLLKHRQTRIEPLNDWRRGSENVPDYGYVMALAHPHYAPHLNPQTRLTLSPLILHFQANRLSAKTDQAEIKHNRLTTLHIADTQARSLALLNLMQEHPDQALHIKLVSRTWHERSTYLYYLTNQLPQKIYFCDPMHGLFTFEDPQTFLTFYQVLYSKEQLEQGRCWNRYQVSAMRYAPHLPTRHTFSGKLTTLFTGLKYPMTPLGAIQGFLLFNTTMYISLIALYSSIAILSVINTAVAAWCFSMLNHSGFSLLLAAAFVMGSPGIYALPDFFKAQTTYLVNKLQSLVRGISKEEDLLANGCNFKTEGTTKPSTNPALLQLAAQGLPPAATSTVDGLAEAMLHRPPTGTNFTISQNTTATDAFTEETISSRVSP